MFPSTRKLAEDLLLLGINNSYWILLRYRMQHSKIGYDSDSGESFETSFTPRPDQNYPERKLRIGCRKIRIAKQQDRYSKLRCRRFALVSSAMSISFFKMF